jgi:hypothetical protein
VIMPTVDRAHGRCRSLRLAATSGSASAPGIPCSRIPDRSGAPSGALCSNRGARG